MCGIYLCIRQRTEANKNLTKHVCLRPRGPDATRIVDASDYYAAFYRLAIVGMLDGMQPFEADHGDIVMLCNGEIYNHETIVKEHAIPVKTHSDCECIIHLYQKLGIDAVLEQITGEFAFIILDRKKQVMHFARDRLGRKPLFYSTDTNTSAFDVCSLFSGLEFEDKQQCIPGKVYTLDLATNELTNYVWHNFEFDNIVRSLSDTHKLIADKFIEAVCMRTRQSERPVGFLLSGGFDSSLVLSVALRYANLTSPPHAFTIGFSEDAPDIKSAEIMVKWLRATYGENCIQWHKVILPIQDGLEAIGDVIQALETYDTTTIRASTPMYLISKYIAEKTNVKVVLSGEGSDELFGGYLYFKYAPSDEAFRGEVLDRLNELYLYDVLRADRTTAACGLEIRPPFLDDQFINVVLATHALVRCKNNTKELIRAAFQSMDLLPDEILHGKKEAFSDAVGMSWKEAIQKFAETTTVDNELSYSQHIPPQTAEMRYFQHVFRSKFGDNAWHVLPYLWLPNQDWVKTGVEPSARVLPVYNYTT
jgi:asparagine synthase (glutamine-hydrolysing)